MRGGSVSDPEGSSETESSESFVSRSPRGVEPQVQMQARAQQQQQRAQPHMKPLQRVTAQTSLAGQKQRQGSRSPLGNMGHGFGQGFNFPAQSELDTSPPQQVKPKAPRAGPSSAPVPALTRSAPAHLHRQTRSDISAARLPDMTGLTAAVETPMKPGRGYKPAKVSANGESTSSSSICARF